MKNESALEKDANGLTSGVQVEQTAQRNFLISLARAFGGALFFSLPLLMTMEMWEQGFTISPIRLAIFLFIAIPILTGLSWYSGFEPTETLKDDLVDAFVAYAIGFCVSAIILFMFAVIHWKLSLLALVGIVSLHAVPASIGALLAQSQFGIQTSTEAQKREETGYGGELFLMVAGAIYLSLSLAPTDEVIFIGYKMTVWHALSVIAFSLLVMHAFMYSLQFRGQDDRPPNTNAGSLFVRFTVVGYALALLVSYYILWTFGRTDGLSSHQNLMNAIVLAFPAAIGAAAARLIL